MQLKINSLKWRLIIVGIFLVISPVVILGGTTYLKVSQEINSQVQSDLKARVGLLTHNIKQSMEITQKKVNSDLNVAHSIFYSYGTPMIDGEKITEIKVTDQNPK